jgi:hypothetical protein
VEVLVGKATVVLLAIAALALLGLGDWPGRLVHGDAAARFLGYEVHVSVMLERAHRVPAPPSASCAVTVEPAARAVTATPATDTSWVRRVLR